MSPTRIRVISDNDYAGDPDGLVQLAHQLLSPSADTRFVIGSHLRRGDPFDPSDRTADHAVTAAAQVAALAGVQARIVAGSNTPLTDRRTPIASAGALAIVEEAMRDDPRPLYVCCGGGLTEIASAWLLEPRIAERLTLVWIGGAEYPGHAAPPDAMPVEYNLLIDIAAAQVVFDDADLVLWQVPRNAYRETLVSMAEFRRRSVGPLGRLLVGELDRLRTMLDGFGMHPGETYALGDSPLVLLTALQSTFEPDPSSSRSEVLPRPSVRDDGVQEFDGHGVPARVFSRLDVRLLFEDFFAKLADLTERDQHTD